MKRPDFIVFRGSKENKYGLINGKQQAHNTQNLI
jgi:hypothetical protein